MNVTVKRSDIELHRNSWKKVAQQNDWYKEPFYVQIWLKDDGRIDDSVSVRDVLTQDYIIPNNEDDTVIIDEEN
jgi:hypothetical protein